MNFNSEIHIELEKEEIEGIEIEKPLYKSHKFFEFLLRFFNVGTAIEIWGNGGEKYWHNYASSRKDDRHFVYFYKNLSEKNRKKFVEWYNNFIKNIDLQTFEIIKKQNPEYEKYKIDNFAEFDKDCMKFAKINNKIRETNSEKISEIWAYKYHYTAAKDIIIFYSLLTNEDKEKLIAILA